MCEHKVPKEFVHQVTSFKADKTFYIFHHFIYFAGTLHCSTLELRTGTKNKVDLVKGYLVWDREIQQAELIEQVIIYIWVELNWIYPLTFNLQLKVAMENRFKKNANLSCVVDNNCEMCGEYWQKQVNLTPCFELWYLYQKGQLCWITFLRVQERDWRNLRLKGACPWYNALINDGKVISCWSIALLLNVLL